MPAISFLIFMFFIARNLVTCWWIRDLYVAAVADANRGKEVNWYLEWDITAAIFHPKYYHLWTSKAWIKHLKERRT